MLIKCLCLENSFLMNGVLGSWSLLLVFSNLLFHSWFCQYSLTSFKRKNGQQFLPCITMITPHLRGSCGRGSSEFRLPQPEEGPARRYPPSWTDAPALRHFPPPVLGSYPRRVLNILTHRWIRALEVKQLNIFSSISLHLVFFFWLITPSAQWHRIASKWEGSLYISQWGKVSVLSTGILTFLANILLLYFLWKMVICLQIRIEPVESGTYFENI